MRKNTSYPKLIIDESELYNLPYHKENKINKLLSNVTMILLCMIIITICICIIFALYVYYIIKN
jgi:hypothetical protein